MQLHWLILLVLSVALVTLAVSALIWAVGSVVVRIIEVVGSPMGALDPGPDPIMSPEEIQSALETIWFDAPVYRVTDPTDWSIPEPSRPKVTRVEHGEGLVPGIETVEF